MLKRGNKGMSFWSLSFKDWKVIIQWVYSECQCCIMLPIELLSIFSSWKTLLLKEEFWGISFEYCKTYGLNIPRRLDRKRDMKQPKNFMI
jgi:hypothetical protein